MPFILNNICSKSLKFSGRHPYPNRVTKYPGYCLDAWGNDQNREVRSLGYYSEEECLQICKDLRTWDRTRLTTILGCERYWDGECFAHFRGVVIGGDYKGDTSAWTCWVFGMAGTLVFPTEYM